MFKYEDIKFLPLGQFGRRVLLSPASVRLSVRPSIRPSGRRSMLVCTITHQGFDLEPPNFYQMSILGRSGSLLKMGMIDLDLHGQMALRTTKFDRKIEFLDGFFSPLNIYRRNVGLVPKCQKFCAVSV